MKRESSPTDLTKGNEMIEAGFEGKGKPRRKKR
jgi:hypothetical protein